MIQEMPELEALAALSEIAWREDMDIALAQSQARLAYARLAQRGSYAVPKLTAAKFLEVHDDTINKWLKLGLLKTTSSPNSPKELIHLNSLLTLKRRLDKLRIRKISRNVTQALLAEIDKPVADKKTTERIKSGITRRSISKTDLNRALLG